MYAVLVLPLFISFMLKKSCASFVMQVDVRALFELSSWLDMALARPVFEVNMELPIHLFNE